METFSWGNGSIPLAVHKILLRSLHIIFLCKLVDIPEDVFVIVNSNKLLSHNLSITNAVMEISCFFLLNKYYSDEMWNGTKKKKNP